MLHNCARPANFKNLRRNRSKISFIIYCVIVGTNTSKGNNSFVTYFNKFYKFYYKSFSQQYICKFNSVKSYFNRYLVGLRTFTMGGGMHGLFESICRSGVNPEKVFRIR